MRTSNSDSVGTQSLSWLSRWNSPISLCFEALQSHLNSTRTCFSDNFSASLAASSQVTRLGFAFVVAYRSALYSMFSFLHTDCPASICISEDGGGHPRSIKTLFDGSKISGSKHWVTAIEANSQLIVIAKVGEVHGHPELRACLLHANDLGVVIESMAPLPFVPEIPHSKIRFLEAPVHPTRILDGDAYTAMIKPFRTYEDVFVLGSCAAYLTSLALRLRVRHVLVEDLLVVINALQSGVRVLAQQESLAFLHLTLGGVLRRFEETVNQLLIELPEGNEEVQCLKRDIPLVRIASRVREARLQRAWQSVLTAGESIE